MKRSKASLAVLIICLLLCAAGLVFVCLSIAGRGDTTRYLALGSICVVVSNVINILYQRSQRNRKDE